MTIIVIDRRRAMAAGFCAIALWGALATLSVTAGPIPPFQMVAMTFAIGAAIGIARARARGVGWSGLFGWPARVWLLGVGGLFGYHALYFAPLRRDADRRHRGVLYGVGRAVVRLSSFVRAHGVAGLDDGVARRAGARAGAGGRGVLSLGSRRQARRHPRARRAVLCHADPVD